MGGSCFAQRQQNRQKVRRGRENQTCAYSRRSAFRKNNHSNEYRASMHWGMVCTTAGAGVYAMTMGSLTDDQIRHSPDYTDEANVSVRHKIYYLQYNIMPNPPAMMFRGQTPTSHLAREPSATPKTPATTTSTVYLNIRQSCCCVRVRGARLFLVLLYRPGGPKSPKSSFRKRLGHTVKRPGAFFYACKAIAPQGAFARITTVCCMGMAVKCQVLHTKYTGTVECRCTVMGTVAKYTNISHSFIYINST